LVIFLFCFKQDLQDYFYFHHFLEESDEIQSRRQAGKITQFFYWQQHIVF